MLTVVSNAWSYTFSVTDGTESVAQAVDLSFWGDKGELRIKDDIYTARRDKSSYLLETAARVLARAEQPRNTDRRYTLRAKSALRRQFLLLEGSRQIGSLSPEGMFTRKTAVELPKAIPLFLQVFIIWLAMTLWKHEDCSAGG